LRLESFRHGFGSRPLLLIPRLSGGADLRISRLLIATALKVLLVDCGTFIRNDQTLRKISFLSF
jgi:hypothetical protein